MHRWPNECMQGLGTWAWGNQLLWGYSESMDAELQEVFNLAVRSGVNLFDTAGTSVWGVHVPVHTRIASVKVCMWTCVLVVGWEWRERILDPHPPPLW
jgi:hypothetical protein